MDPGNKLARESEGILAQPRPSRQHQDMSRYLNLSDRKQRSEKLKENFSFSLSSRFLLAFCLGSFLYLSVRLFLLISFFYVNSSQAY